jgi:hypothetical protein
MGHDMIDPHEAAAAFAALAVILAGEVLLILGTAYHDVALPPLAQMVTRVFFAH